MIENWRLAELVLAELDGERAGVVLDRRDVVDRLAEALVQEPLERGLLDVDQVGEVENVLQARESLARARRSNPAGQMETPPLEMFTAGGRANNWARTLQDTESAGVYASENAHDGGLFPWPSGE